MSSSRGSSSHTADNDFLPTSVNTGPLPGLVGSQISAVHSPRVRPHETHYLTESTPSSEVDTPGDANSSSLPLSCAVKATQMQMTALLKQSGHYLDRSYCLYQHAKSVAGQVLSMPDPEDPTLTVGLRQDAQAQRLLDAADPLAEPSALSFCRAANASEDVISAANGHPRLFRRAMRTHTSSWRQRVLLAAQHQTPSTSASGPQERPLRAFDAASIYTMIVGFVSRHHSVLLLDTSRHGFNDLAVLLERYTLHPDQVIRVLCTPSIATSTAVSGRMCARIVALGRRTILRAEVFRTFLVEWDARLAAGGGIVVELQPEVDSAADTRSNWNAIIQNYQSEATAVDYRLKYVNGARLRPQQGAIVDPYQLLPLKHSSNDVCWALDCCNEGEAADQARLIAETESIRIDQAKNSILGLPGQAAEFAFEESYREHGCRLVGFFEREPSGNAPRL